MSDKIREAFDAWRSSGSWTRPDDPGEWAAWQAALAQQPAPVAGAQEPHTFWVLFDATTAQRFIKKMLPEGFLAFFDCEGDAQRAKASNPGTDYKRVDYYTITPAAGHHAPDHVEWWANAYEKEGGHAVIVGMLRAYRDLLAVPAPVAVPDGVTMERIERHAQPAGGCPSSAMVVLLSSIKRMLATPAAPVAVGQDLPHWEPCNPACDPELNGYRSKLCDCAKAKAALAATPAAEQPDTVKVPRKLATALLDEGKRSDTWAAQDKLRALMAGGEA